MPEASDAETRDARANAAVEQALRHAAGDAGVLSFDRFMEIALYEPGVGYYERRPGPLGADGDFYTAAHTSPLFGRTIARRLSAEWQALGSPTTFAIAELGSGDGRLAQTLIEEAGRLGDFGTAVRYVLVERSRSLAERALERLRPLTSHLRWVPRLSELGPFSGAVVANEFFDALPCRRFESDGTDWREIGVRWSSVGWTFAPLAAGRTLGGPPLPRPGPAGTVIEWPTTAFGVVRAIADHLTRGVALVFDYGASEDEIGQRYPRGTLVAVRNHRAIPNILDQPGAQDLSAWVNFTRLNEYAEAAGLSVVSDDRQSEALGAWGGAEVLGEIVRDADAVEAVRARLAAKNLLFGFSNFRAVVWRAGPARARSSSGPAPG